MNTFKIIEKNKDFGICVFRKKGDHFYRNSYWTTLEDFNKNYDTNYTLEEIENLYKNGYFANTFEDNTEYAFLNIDYLLFLEKNNKLNKENCDALKDFLKNDFLIEIENALNNEE